MLLVFNPGEPHSGRMARSSRWRYRSLYLSQAAIDEVTSTLGIEGTPYFTTNVFPDADLVAAFLALHRALEQRRDPFGERELLVASFGALIVRHSSESHRVRIVPRDRRSLDAVTALMRARHAESLTLDEMGRFVGLTPFQLLGLFKRGTGLTPHAYLTQVRLNSAIRHLKARSSIAEAALAAGFYDQSALTSHFKRAYGITPLKFAKAIAK